MSKEYESKTEHKENLIDIAGLFDDLIKGIIQMKWRFLIILVICGAVFCGYKRLTYSPYYVASSTFTIVRLKNALPSVIKTMIHNLLI